MQDLGQWMPVLTIGQYLRPSPDQTRLWSMLKLRFSRSIQYLGRKWICFCFPTFCKKLLPCGEFSGNLIRTTLYLVHMLLYRSI